MTESVSELCNMLGFQYSGWLRLLTQNMLYSDVTGTMVDDGMGQSLCAVAYPEYDNSLLILSQKGLPNVGAPYVVPTVWPYDPVILVTYNTESSVTISYGGKNYTASCGKTTGRLVIDWPAELNVVGDVDTTTKQYTAGYELKLHAGSVYPAEEVVEKIRQSGAIYSIDGTYVSAVATSSSALDSLAIMTYALYKTLHG